MDFCSQDGPKFMAEDAKLYNYPFPYLYDETQDVVRDFGAVCTPEFFLFKKARLPNLNQVGNCSRYSAVPRRFYCWKFMIYHYVIHLEDPPSVGCSIKWHPQKSS